MSWSEWTIKSQVNGYTTAYASAVPHLLVTDEGFTGRISKVIDFIPAGKDFVVIANSGSVNLSVSAHLEMYVGYSRTGTFYRHKPGVTGYPFLADRVMDNTSNKLVYDVSSYGGFPYYKLYIPAGTGITGGTNVLSFRILVEEE